MVHYEIRSLLPTSVEKTKIQMRGKNRTLNPMEQVLYKFKDEVDDYITEHLPFLDDLRAAANLVPHNMEPGGAENYGGFRLQQKNKRKKGQEPEDLPTNNRWNNKKPRKDWTKKNPFLKQYFDKAAKVARNKYWNKRREEAHMHERTSYWKNKRKARVGKYWVNKSVVTRMKKRRKPKVIYG